MFRAIVVDDEPQARNYLARMIPEVSPGWEVVGSAANGREALEIYAACPSDLVITDIRMPEMDGFELSGAVREINPDVFIVFISGYEEFSYAKQAIELGAGDYLTKPISRKSILAMLQKAERKITEKREYARQSDMMRQLSDDYRNELIRNLCQAALENNYIRIQTLQPLLYRMQIQQMQKDWCVIAAFAECNLSAGFDQLAQNRYLFLQLVRDLIETRLRYGYVVEANDGTLLLCIMGDNEEETEDLADRAAEAAAELCRKNLHLSMSSCRSAVKLDTLELHEAHREADALFPLTALYGVKCHGRAGQDERVDELNGRAAAVVDAWGQEDMTSLPGCVRQYCKMIPDQLLQYGILHLLHLAHKAYCPHLQTIEKQMLQLPCRDGEETAFAIIEIFSRAVSRERDRSANEKLIDDAVLIIRANLSEPISLGFVADRLKVSANHLSRLFHTVTGESYSHFLTRERMEMAARMLRQSPEMKVYDIAEKTGYFNVQHFCHVFHEYWGMSPTQYQHQGEDGNESAGPEE